MKCGRARLTLRSLMARALSLSAVATLMLNQTMIAPALAGDYRIGAAPSSADGQSNARFLSLGVGKSVVIDLPRDVKDVLVADPKIANAVVRSAQRAYIIGAAVGQTNIVFFELDVAGLGFDAHEFSRRLAVLGVRIGAFDDRTLRAVTHLDVSAADIERCLEAAAAVLATRAG